MSRNKKKSSNKRKLHKTSKKVNQNRISTTPNTGQTSTTPSTGQTSTTPNTGQTSNSQKKTNQYEKSAAKNKTPDEEIVEVDRGQASTTPNTGQTSTPKKSRYIDCFALFRSIIQRCIIYTYYIKKNLLIQKRINTKNPQQKINHPIKKSSKWIVDKLQLLLISDKLLPPKKVDILIVLRYSIPLFKGVLTISKKFINTETNQYKKSAANRDELSDEVEIVKVARGQTSTTPATGQVYQKNY
ncbi:uncharacterized protein OCT59_020533 [Rhizophagus irregularis]|uniref:uncharacterized protein n=1 Tax=Rhizophagus irregularis TaxID=588596 RepID=UPI0033206C48|nr:hypothetical protein OCT59_020533 [Rhizophagus irregularis]